MLQDLGEAQEQGGMEKFTDAVAEFDSLMRLDQWQSMLPLRVVKLVRCH